MKKGLKLQLKILATAGLLAQAPLVAQDCVCGAPCELLLEADISQPVTVTACNVVTVIGAEILTSGVAEIRAGDSVSFFSGFAMEGGGELAVVIESPLSCDPMIDADVDGVDQCLDCDEADENNWVSCGACVDGDGDSAWTGCDAYVTLIGPDCDDDDVDRHPGVVETCNSIDDNCDGLIDECLNCAP